MTEYDQVVLEARIALEMGSAKDFQLTGEALKLAKEMGIPAKTVRTHFLIAAYLQILAAPRRELSR